jgi:TolB-like protein/tRNA A-37 threonylcarbamoyl transferase component Bud32
VPDLLEQLRQALAERYRLERELGQGGMATVYLAEDLKHRRKVALKVLRPELAATLGAERFLREIELSARLTHPHILPLHDSGNADGFLYYVMPYVEGESLRDRLTREKQLPLDDAVRIAREVADALGYAHAQGVIHRDVKPENVLLQSGHAVVADFGIARAVSAAGGTRLTETGLAVGTPAYMSPEQAAGEADIDARSDLYSLGCVLYEMLSGETPYTGPTPQAILAKKLTEPVPRITVVRETVPAAVESALETALAKSPADRFPTVQEFAAALERPGGRVRRAGLRVRRRWLRVAVAAAIVVAVAGAGWLGWRTLRGGGGARIRSLVVLPPQDLSGDTAQAYFVLGVYDGLVGELQQVGALRVISRTSGMAYLGTTKPVPQIARELNVDGVVEASVLRQGDSLHLRVELVQAGPTERTVWGRKYDRDIRGVLKLYAEVAKDVAREAGAGLTGAQAARFAAVRDVDPQTYEAYVKGMYYLAKGGPEANALGLATLREAIDRDPGDPLAWAGLAVGYITLAHGPNPPVDALPAARAAAERALRIDSTLSETMASLAFLKGYYDWEWEAADSLFRRTLQLNPSSALAHYWYSWQLYLFDQGDSAIAEHKRAQATDPLDPGNTAWLGDLYFDLDPRRTDDALAEVRRAIAIDSTYSEAYVIAVGPYLAKGDTAAAVASAHRAVALDPAWRWILGRVYALTGRRAEARRILTELQAEKVTPWNAFGLAVLNASLGDNDQAFRWLNYEHPHAWVPWVRVAPWFASLRNDPRLSALLAKMHLPPRGQT